MYFWDTLYFDDSCTFQGVLFLVIATLTHIIDNLNAFKGAALGAGKGSLLGQFQHYEHFLILPYFQT